jgi:hypothetical protein
MFFPGSILRMVTGSEGVTTLAGISVVCRPDWRKAKDSWRMVGPLWRLSFLNAENLHGIPPLPCFLVCVR